MKTYVQVNRKDDCTTIEIEQSDYSIIIIELWDGQSGINITTDKGVLIQPLAINSVSITPRRD